MPRPVSPILLPNTPAVRSAPWRRPARAAVWVLLVPAALVLALFPFWGRLLVRSDALDRADAAVVLGGSRSVRWLEAAELFREGFVPRILLLASAEDDGEVLLRDRGITIPTDAELARDALRRLGIPTDAVSVVGGRHTSTADEARTLRQAVEANRWRAVIVVTSRLHTRRAGLAVERHLAGTGARVIVRATRFERSNPARWWRSRRDVYMTVTEWSKLVLYGLGLAG